MGAADAARHLVAAFTLGAVVLLVEPRPRLVARDLGMELDAPRVPVEPKCLRTDRAACELGGARRNVERVVVPLERVEAWR